MDESIQQPGLFDSIAADLQIRGYSIQKNALPCQLVSALHQAITLLHPEALRPAGVGRAGQHMTNPSIRRDEIAWIERDDGVQGQWLDFCTQLQQHLNRALWLGLFSFESHFAHYEPGAFYKTHVDAFKGQANRVLSVVLYLNPQWGNEDGGEMVLYSETQPATILERIEPLAGTLAVFLSEVFPHEVLPTKRDRFSIAGWYRLNTTGTHRVEPPA